MRGRLVLVLLALLAVLPATGCGSGGSLRGECGVLFRFDDTIYQAVGAQQIPARGTPLGRAGYLECGDTPAPTLGKVDVFAFGTIDPKKAVIVAGRRTDVVYVNRHLPRNRWPPLVVQAAAILKCTKPMTFQGRWNFIYTDTSPGDELYDIPVPYRALFTARTSESIDPATWASWTIRARVTKDTTPIPAVATAKTAIKRRQPVTVSTICRGDNFEVTHLELSR